MDLIASIEIGSNSIRMLIAEKGESDNTLRPVLRKRAITRLGEDFNRGEIGTIKPKPMSRSIAVLKEFFDTASRFGVPSPTVIATGVVRKAANRDSLIALIAERLDHSVRIISGEEEAELTCRGVLSSLNHIGGPLIIFDLGGGSTEFTWINNRDGKSISIELGAVILTEGYLINDPPREEEIYQLSNHIDHTFKIGLDSLKQIRKKGFSIIGTGGTIVTLAKIIHGIAEDDFNDKRINGLAVNREDIWILFQKMKGVSKKKRLNFKGLETGREDIILAGALVVAKIMDYFEKDEIIVSYSDLLEGILIHHMEGEKNGWSNNKGRADL
jgi:exopolyphosphatase/guanosine-5'-triphosphate,3'-diphosphate pyrophosphatase